MDGTEASSARTEGGTHHPTHYNADLRVVSPRPEVLSRLLQERGVGPSSSVAEAVPLPHEVALRVNKLLDEAGSPRRVGPTIGMHRETVEPNRRFQLDNFFGLPVQSRHTNPNKVLVNVGSSPFDIDIAHATDPESMHAVSAASAMGVSVLDIDPADVTSLTIAPGQALILPCAMAPYRYLTTGELLVLHGFFVE